MRIILTESLIILGLLLLNGIFAMSEIAVVTSRRARLERQASDGSRGARQALTLVDEPTRFLSTVQIGITLIGVLAGAFGGATIAEEIDARMELVPALAPFSEALSLGIVVVVVSFFSLVVGELVPKRIAMQSPERIAASVAIPMQWIARLAAPLVDLLSFTTRSILRLLGVTEVKGTRVTEDEIRAVIAEGRQSGAVLVAEHEMLEGVFRLGERVVRDLMIPRPDVDWVDVDGGLSELQLRLTRPRSEAVLVCRGSLDEIVGIVRPNRLLGTLLAGRSLDLTAEAESPIYVPGSMDVLRLLDQFRHSRQRLAVVLDEYGGVEGVVSLDGLLEEVVGEVPSSADEEASPPQIVARADGSFLVDGSAEFAEVAERFGLSALPVRERGSYRTVAGFVMQRLGRVPRLADQFSWSGVRFEVIDMDERRVDKVLIVPAARGPHAQG